MEDIIPFLIVIAISIVGSVSRAKKKRAMKQNSAQQPKINFANKNNDIYNWLEKLSGEEEERPIPHNETLQNTPRFAEEDNTEKTIPESIIKKTANPYEKYSGFISPKERQELIKKEGESALDKKTDDKKILTNEPVKSKKIDKKILKQDFDLKKAVIYSEILNRKY